MANALDTALNVFVRAGGVQNLGEGIQRRQRNNEQKALFEALKQDVFFSSMFGQQAVPGVTNQPLGGLNGGNQKQQQSLQLLAQDPTARDSLFLGNIFKYANNPEFGDSGKQFAAFALSQSDKFLGDSSGPTNQVNAVVNSALNTLATTGNPQAFSQQLAQSIEVVDPRARATLQSIARSPDPVAAARNYRAILGGAEEIRKSALSREENVLSADEQIRVAEEKAIIETLKEKAKSPDAPKQSDIAGMRKEFTALSNEFIKVRDAFSRISTSPISKEEATGASDISLIFNYMKMLDPTSVVRESEFATAENAGGVAASVRNQYNRLINGDKLDSQVRIDFAEQAERLFDKQSKQQEKRVDEFGRIADLAGIPKEQVIVDLSAASDSPDSGGLITPQTQADFDALPSGAIYIDPDDGLKYRKP